MDFFCTVLHIKHKNEGKLGAILGLALCFLMILWLITARIPLIGVITSQSHHNRNPMSQPNLNTSLST